MSKPVGSRRGIVVIDAAHTRRQIIERGQQDFWLARDHHGFFDLVWGVHPLADVVEPGEQRTVQKFSSRQLVIEGKTRSFSLPALLYPVNVLLSQLSLLFWLRKQVRQRAWLRVIYAADPIYCGLFGWTLARLTARPLIVFIPANYDELWAESRVLAYPRLFRSRAVEKLVMHFVFRRADMIVAVADSVYRLALRYGGEASRIMRGRHGKFIAKIHMSAPESRMLSRETADELGLPKAANYLLFVSRLIDLKLPQDAVRAMAKIIKERPDTVGIIAGDGERRGQLEALAAKLGAAPRIIFTGNLPQETLSILYSKSIILSPLTGMALIEAALAGSAIIAYDRDFQAEFLDHGNTGVIVPFRDTDAMASEAIALIDDPAVREEIGQAARQMALAFVDPVANGRTERIALTELIEHGTHREERFQRHLANALD